MEVRAFLGANSRSDTQEIAILWKPNVPFHVQTATNLYPEPD
jgi:hypothetical protein